MSVLDRLKYIAKVAFQPNHWTVHYVGGLVAELLPFAEADAQALADVRTLESHTTAKQFWRPRPVVTRSWEYVRMVWSDTFKVFEIHECFQGPTPDAARHAAAEWVREQAKMRRRT